MFSCVLRGSLKYKTSKSKSSSISWRSSLFKWSDSAAWRRNKASMRPCPKVAGKRQAEKKNSIQITEFDGFGFLWTSQTSKKRERKRENWWTQFYYSNAIQNGGKRANKRARDAPLFAITRCDVFFVPCSGPLVGVHKKSASKARSSDKTQCGEGKSEQKSFLK